MAPIPKPRREEDKPYSAFIETLPCIVGRTTSCHYGEDGKTIGHHLQAKGHGGKSTKCPDKRRIPVCFGHHAEIHTGRETFLKKYGIDGEAMIATYNSIWDRICALGPKTP